MQYDKTTKKAKKNLLELSRSVKVLRLVTQVI